MKSLALVIMIAFSALGTNVLASTDLDNFVTSLQSFNAQSGKIVMNGKEKGNCTVEVDDSGDGLTVRLVAPSLYADPVSVALLDRAKLLSNNTLLVSTNSNRPGGDACGDFGGESGYKEIISYDENSVSIDVSFRCFLVKKYKISYTCELN